MSKLQDRREKKYTRSELTTLLNLPPQTIRLYEQGHMQIDGAKIKTLAKLARALDCKISDLIEDPETVNLLRELTL